jgi:hypothetical protein
MFLELTLLSLFSSYGLYVLPIVKGTRGHVGLTLDHVVLYRKGFLLRTIVDKYLWYGRLVPKISQKLTRAMPRITLVGGWK